MQEDLPLPSIDNISEVELNKPESIIQALFDMGFIMKESTLLEGSLVNLIVQYTA